MNLTSESAFRPPKDNRKETADVTDPKGYKFENFLHILDLAIHPYSVIKDLCAGPSIKAFRDIKVVK